MTEIIKDVFVATEIAQALLAEWQREEELFYGDHTPEESF